MTTGQDFDTRIVFSLNPTLLCKKTGNFTFSVTINTLTKAVSSDSFVDLQTFVDEIGIFKGAFWRANPILSLTVSEIIQVSSEGTLDIAPIFPEQPVFV